MSAANSDTTANSIEQGKSGARAARIPTNVVLALCIWSVVVACLSGLAALHFAQRQFDNDLAMRPPIVVVDSFGWIKGAGTGPTVEARYLDGARRLNATVAKLHARGALVIDSSAVRAAPDAVRLATPTHTTREQDGGELPQ